MEMYFNLIFCRWVIGQTCYMHVFLVFMELSISMSAAKRVGLQMGHQWLVTNCKAVSHFTYIICPGPFLLGSRRTGCLLCFSKVVCHQMPNMKSRFTCCYKRIVMSIVLQEQGVNMCCTRLHRCYVCLYWATHFINECMFVVCLLVLP